MASPDVKTKKPISSAPSDFERTFRPFKVKKEAEVAPINFFQQPLWKRLQVIVIDDDEDVQMSDPFAMEQECRMTPKGMIVLILFYSSVS